MQALQTDEAAIEFANKHVKVWNSHDLEGILDLYSASAELASPLAHALTGGAPIRGRDSLRAYFEQALEKYPKLQFELLHTFRCTDSITLLFRGAGQRLVAEVLFLDTNGRIERVLAHYCCDAK
jgi:hypothetical protein